MLILVNFGEYENSMKLTWSGKPRQAGQAEAAEAVDCGAISMYVI